MADFFGSAASGIQAGFAGGPVAGLLTFGVNIFASQAAENAQDEYNNQIAALAASDKQDRRQQAILQKAENVIRFEQSVEDANRFRKQTVYRQTMLQAGVEVFSAATGLEGSSFEQTSKGRLQTEQSLAVDRSFSTQRTSEDIFKLQQGQIDVLADFDTEDVFKEFVQGNPDVISPEDQEELEDTSDFVQTFTTASGAPNFG